MPLTSNAMAESNLFKSITERNLTDEQRDEFRKLKKLTRDWVSNQSDSSDSSESDLELGAELELETELQQTKVNAEQSALSISQPVRRISQPVPTSLHPVPTSSHPVPTSSHPVPTSSQPVRDAFSSDEKQQLVKKYINGEITFIEFTDLLEKRNLLEDNKSKTVEEDQSLPMEVDEAEVEDESVEEDDGTLSYEDNEEDEDYMPPKPTKKLKVIEKKEKTIIPKQTSKKKRFAANFEKESPFDESLCDTMIAGEKKRRRRRPNSRLPADLQGLVGEANLCYVRGDYEDAIRMCMEVIRLAPHAPGPFQTLGMIYEEMGDMDKSLQFALIAAYLMPNDSEEWTRLGEMSLERNNIKQAIICYGKAIRSDPTNVDLMWTRCRLYEQMGDKKKVLEQLQQIAKAYKPEEGEMILQVIRDITRRLYDNGLIELAKSAMEEAFNKHSDHITSEDVNLLLELMMKQNQHAESIRILCDFCGVQFDPPVNFTSASEQELNLSELTLKNRTCITPEVLPIDLSAKLFICLLHLGSPDLTTDLRLTLLQESPDDVGDLYLDVAEAYMETGFPKEALPLLASLAGSEKYNLPFVWQKYGECQMATGNLVESERIYRRVVELAPDHAAARMVLSGILQQLGRPNESLSVLTTGMTDAVELDPPLQIQRANLLYARGEWDEFILAAKLLHSAHTIWKNDYTEAIATCNIGKVRDLYKIWKDEMDGQLLIGEDSVHCEEIWDIYKKMCQKMLDLGRVEELAYVTLTAQASSIFKDKTKLKECHFMHLLACFFNRDLDRAYQMIKFYVSWDDSTNRKWNIFNLIVGLLRQLKHNRFCIRQMYKNPDHIQLGILNGHTAFAAGSYKHALGEYMNVFKSNPKDPLIAFCIGLTYTHIACQKFTTKKHSLILQATSFFNLYRELRGDGQETYYNIGRAMHQFGLTYVAIDYYKKALEFPPAVSASQSPDYQIYDLRREIAYNLSLIYSKSGSLELARMYIYKYCIV